MSDADATPNVIEDSEPTAVVPEGASATPSDAAADPVFRVMNVESVTFDLGDPSPQVHLMEGEAPYRHLSVPIALPEAQALHAAMHNLTGRRPSTHELASAIIRQFAADIIAVRVTHYDAGVFYAELDVMTPRGREVFDARPSDAFILALRQAVSAPILCDEQVLAQFYVS
jgi:bifunctional DNase/RNase